MLIHEIVIFSVDTTVHPLKNCNLGLSRGNGGVKEKNNVIVFILSI